MKHYAINTKVKWPWGNGEGEGYIRQKYTERVTKVIDGTEVTRDADDNYPAYLIEQTDGTEVLKAASELRLEAVEHPRLFHLLKKLLFHGVFLIVRRT